MTKPTATVKNRYASKAYDRIGAIIPKGRKEEIAARAEANGTNINKLINDFFMEYLGMTEEQWKTRSEACDDSSEN